MVNSLFVHLLQENQYFPTILFTGVPTVSADIFLKYMLSLDFTNSQNADNSFWFVVR